MSNLEDNKIAHAQVMAVLKAVNLTHTSDVDLLYLTYQAAYKSGQIVGMKESQEIYRVAEKAKAIKS